MMRKSKGVKAVAFGGGVIALVMLTLYVPSLSIQRFTARAQTTTLPETIVLAEKAALGKVTFSHSNHITKNYNILPVSGVQR